MSKTPVPISASKVQARFRDLVVPYQINLTSGRGAKRLHQYPACGGRDSGRRDHSTAAFQAMVFGGSSTWIRQD